MICKALLKNKKQCKIPQEFTKICLNDYSTKARKQTVNTSGISIKFEDKWFILPKGLALFKSDDLSYSKKDLLAINEVICSELAKKLNVKCADYDFAHFVDSENKEVILGVVSYSFIKDFNNEKIIPLSVLYEKFSAYLVDDIISFDEADNTISNISTILDTREIKSHFEFSKNDILFDLFKIKVFDYLTSNTDRHPNNLCMFVKRNDDGKDHLSVVPMFDNERTFNEYQHEFWNSKQHLSDFLDGTGYYFLERFHCFNGVNEASYYNKHLGVEYVAKLNAKDIILYSNKNKVYRDFLNATLNKIKKINIKNILSYKGVVLNGSLTSWYKSWIDYKIQIMEDLIKELETTTKGNKNEIIREIEK